MPRRSINRDPKQAGAKPPYSSRKQSSPGMDSKMAPQADHGERSYVGSSRLIGKVAIITGGDSGIGRAIAIAYAREGADIVLSYLETEQKRRPGNRAVGRRGWPEGSSFPRRYSEVPILPKSSENGD